jgi:anti-anti-sigma regulatory factor
MEMDHSVQVNPIVHGGPGGMVRIVLAGELDAYAVPTVRAARDAASATPGRLEIDLAGVTVLSVAMVAVLSRLLTAAAVSTCATHRPRCGSFVAPAVCRGG